MSASFYDESLRRVLEHEGGYTNDANDPGGPTNWGITIGDARAYWKNDATAADVKAMPLDVAKQIYRSKYWDAMSCNSLPAGVDYCVFDYGVNSGISRSAKVLQSFVGVPQDGEIGQDTIAATAKANAAQLIDRICDQRMAFLKGLSTWGTFGRGWSTRVADVRAAAKAIAAAAPVMPVAQPDQGAAILAKARSYIGKFHDGPDVPRMAYDIGKAFPEFATYVMEANNDMPWCGDFVAYVLMQFGIKPAPVKDGVGFFYVNNWLNFGIPIPVGQERPGDVCLFIYPGTLHHVTFVAGNGRYVGGNQSDAVTETSFAPKPSAIRRAPFPAVITQDKPKPSVAAPVAVPVAAGGAAAYGLHLIGAHPAWIAAAIVAGVLIGAFIWNWRKS